MRAFALLFGFGLIVAAPTRSTAQKQASHDSANPAKQIIVAFPNRTTLMDFNGTEVLPIASLINEDMHFSWIVFKEPNHIYGTNENAKNLRHFTYDTEAKNLTVVGDIDGSAGVVHLEFNKNKTRMIGSAFADGTIDIWDTSETDGTPKLIKSLKVKDHINGTISERQGAPHQHQAVLDPTGRFFAVNDLGGDAIRIVSVNDDLYEIVNTIRVPNTEKGCGVRHGAFHGEADSEALHYLVDCELSNKILSFNVKYQDGNLELEFVHSISTFQTPPEADPTGNFGPAAGELLISKTGNNVYVSNRRTPNAEAKTPDSISIFNLLDCGKLTFKQSFETGGRLPRGISLSNDDLQTFLFVGNQAGTTGTSEAALAAFKRNIDGSVVDTPAAIAAFEPNDSGFVGPSFVQEVPFFPHVL